MPGEVTVPTPQTETGPVSVLPQKSETPNRPIAQQARELGRKIWDHMRRPKSNPDTTLQVEENAYPEYPSRFKIDIGSLDHRIREYIQYEIENNTPNPALTEYWKKEGFEVMDALRNLHGPIVEVGGPTTGGFSLVDLSNLDKNIFVSNIEPGTPYYDDQTGEFIEYAGKVDFQADATKLPLASNKVGALFASCLVSPIVPPFIDEAMRSLEPGGLLVYQGGSPENMKYALKAGFQVVESQSEKFQHGVSVNAIFIKPETLSEPLTKEQIEAREVKELLDNLRLVGPKKPLGYLPLSTLVDVCKTDPSKIEQELKQKGLKTIMFNGWTSGIVSGALFAYDEAALDLMLKANEDLLKEANWPTDPELFVKHLKVVVGTKTKLFDLIADAFNDKTNPGRTDVVSGITK